MSFTERETSGKPPKRHVADPVEWAAIRREKLGPCRVCERKDGKIDLHHLVPRSLGGDDVAANLVPLCEYHHDRFERGPKREVGAEIGKTLLETEIEYVRGRARRLLETYYGRRDL